MRRRHHIGVTKQRIGLGRLLREHVESRARDMAGLEQSPQRDFVHQPATRAIDDPHALLGLGEVLGRQDVLGLRRHRRVQRDEIGPRQQPLQFDLLDADLLRALFAQERIERNHPHLQAQSARSRDRTDIAAADDPERLGGDLDAHEAVLLPLAGLRRGVGGGNFARQSKHHRNRMFCGGDRIAERRVHHDHAARRGGGNIDVIDADAGAAHDLQPRRAFEQLRRHLGVGADRQPIVVADDFGEFVLVQTGLDVNRDAALAEDFDGGGREFVGDENARNHEKMSFYVMGPSPSWRAKRSHPAPP